MLLKRFWAHVDDRGTRQAIEAMDVYRIEADGSATLVYLRSVPEAVRDQRSIGEVLNSLQKIFSPSAGAAEAVAGSFVRIHRSHAVNLLHVASIRRRSSRDFEVAFAAPEPTAPGQALAAPGPLPIGRKYWDGVRERLD